MSTFSGLSPDRSDDNHDARMFKPLAEDHSDLTLKASHCSPVTVAVSLADICQQLTETSSLEFGTCSSYCRWQR
jgi:hypothetical protein